MLRERQRTLDTFHVLASGVFSAGGFCLSYFILSFQEIVAFMPFNQYLGLIFVFSGIATLALWVRQFSVSSRFITPGIIFRELLICQIIGFFGFSFCEYLFKFPHMSRIFVFVGMLLGLCILMIWHFGTYWFYREMRSRNLNYRNVLLVGNHHVLPPFIKAINRNKAWGLKIIGILNIEDSDRKSILGFPVIGLVAEMEKILDENIVDYVIFSVYRQNPPLVEKAILTCQERGVQVCLRPDFIQKGVYVSGVDYLEDIPLFILSLGPKFGPALMIKSILDFISSGILLLIFSVPILIIMILVKQTTHGSAFFVQHRVGSNGRKFRMYKFRTMYHDHEQRKAEYELRNEMKGPVFKMKNDPRVTPIGRVLRKFSLDELPQLWNVFIGDMSLVGPRPPLPTEVSLYRNWQRRRLSMRPGITCIWQVTGRNKITDFKEWARLDLKYIDEWSLWLDLKILFMTVPAVVKGTGL